MARGVTVRLKVFALSAGLLLLAEAVTLATIYATIRTEVERNIATQLEVGREVFRAQFDARLRYLAVYSRLLGKDFGLLSTLHDDPKSLLVAVNNHRSRVGADLAIVTDADGVILADTAQPERAGQRLTLARAVREDLPAPQGGAVAANANLFVDTGSAVYQLAAAPLQAPNTIGWIYLGFAVDDGLARQFESITGLQVSFIGPAPGGGLRVIASTFDPARRAELAERGEAVALGRAHDATLAGEHYIGLGLQLQPDGGAFAVLHRSRDAALAAYAPWWLSISEVVAAALLLALFGAWAVARSIARPIGVLVEQARAIGRGNYAHPIALRESGELGELADEFNQMQHAISEREDSIRYNAWHDALTGLANRGRLEALVDERIRGAPRDERRLALLIVDLDRFKDINETLGYHAGDRLLKEVGERLRGAMPGDAVVARLGGAEFGVLLEGVALGALHPAVDALCNTLMRPYLAEGLELYLTVTVGTAVFPDHGNDAGALLRHADAARFAAKERRLRHVVYEGTQDRYSLLRVSLLGELRAAMARGDLRLHYQPKLDLDSDLVRTVEALVRWQHPTYGAIPPSEFIPMVEHTGNITMLTSWVLRTALEQLAAWDAEGIRLEVAVNVSAYDLRHAELLDTIEQALADTGLKAERLTLELTESAVVEELAQVRNALAQLDALGCRIAIDDYGTGYSSLAQLKRLPVDELKIDQSFVSVVDRNPDDEVIVRSTIDLGHNMGLKVVAEGVETPQVLRVLRRLGCDTIQGYLLSKPVSAAALAEWLRARNWRELAEVRA